ncbi:CLUMA_CG018506, isoform A [Clunio marinus]|uniref:CLUMA_CG018506, isoform A n=1 Tax=Clunio marinus TaxID=568069 RepID=A0A1J1J3G6_9DIPT|nr:CLUMA_CG018506, isoform A [Clunio marinus]
MSQAKHKMMQIEIELLVIQLVSRNNKPFLTPPPLPLRRDICRLVPRVNICTFLPIYKKPPFPAIVNSQKYELIKNYSKKTTSLSTLRATTFGCWEEKNKNYLMLISNWVIDSNGIYKIEQKRNMDAKSTKPLIINTIICRIFFEITSNIALNIMQTNFFPFDFPFQQTTKLPRKIIRECAKVRRWKIANEALSYFLILVFETLNAVQHNY